MSRMRVMTIVGTRPEIIKLSRVIAELDLQMNHVLVHTGQNFDYELNQVFFDELEIRKPNHFLESAADTPACTIANVIKSSDEIFDREKPEAVLVLGDTNSCLAVIGAKRRRIPIFHMEAGNRCFDQRVPEETNRKIIDHISDINLVYTEHARRHLLAEALHPATIIKTGSPMREVLSYYGPKISNSNVLARLDLPKEGYLVVSAHREENVDSPERLERLLSTLVRISEHYRLPIIISVHPRTARRLEMQPNRHGTSNSDLRFVKPLGFLDYVRLQQDAFCVLSDSGTLTEEASILDFPGVMLRDAHERPEGMDVGAVVMTGLEEIRVIQGIDLVRAQRRNDGRSFSTVEDYEVLDVSRKVVRIIASYRDYVKQTVWRE